jgi:hypothetical protein
MRMSISFKLDFVFERARGDAENEEQEIRPVRIPHPEAREVWQQVLEHKWYMSERLGRDVGLGTAAIDYFESIRRRRTLNKAGETIPPALPFMRPLDYR